MNFEKDYIVMVFVKEFDNRKDNSYEENCHLRHR